MLFYAIFELNIISELIVDTVLYFHQFSLLVLYRFDMNDACYRIVILIHLIHSIHIKHIYPSFSTKSNNT